MVEALIVRTEGGEGAKRLPGASSFSLLLVIHEFAFFSRHTNSVNCMSKREEPFSHKTNQVRKEKGEGETNSC